jgi:hypothetical protein
VSEAARSPAFKISSTLLRSAFSKSRFSCKNSRVANDHTEQVIEIVRHSSGQSAHRFHFLGLAELLFEFPALANIAIYYDEFLDFTFLVANCARRRLQNAPGSILVMHSVLNTSGHTADACLARCFLHSMKIIGMYLLEGTMYFLVPPSCSRGFFDMTGCYRAGDRRQ